ncbi:hypothetical protein Golomagni_06899, partial [Golovinomyces magnicellulatus]
MVANIRTGRLVVVIVICFCFLVLFQTSSILSLQPNLDKPSTDDFIWRKLKPHYPVKPTVSLPKNPKTALPNVQATPKTESSSDKATRLTRQKAVKDAFQRSWAAYKEHAWLKDEVTPVSGKSKDNFGGWGATLIDSLDTLWIMDLQDDFEEAVKAVQEHITFETTKADDINLFETNIRFLGGLISAYDLSGDPRLLRKATDVGDMIFMAFDTPNHMPVARWNPHKAQEGEKQGASSSTLLAELGSFTMEFTRLSLITGNVKYYNAVQHISELLDHAQMKTKLPGLWPILINANELNLDAGNDYTLGAMADSAYEYLSKMVALLGDKDTIYSRMHTRSMNAAEKHLFYRPRIEQDVDILFSGLASPPESASQLGTGTGHLSCFVGGMLALGGKLLSNDSRIDQGAQFARGCIWSYESTTSGVMPEGFSLSRCPDLSPCNYTDVQWEADIGKENNLREAQLVKDFIANKRLPKGYTDIPDARYILRPEAIES